MLSSKAKAEGYTLNYEAGVYEDLEVRSKQADITYYDDGNLIPISKRFDSENSDPRYSYKRPSEGKVHKQIAEWEKLRVYEKVDAERFKNASPLKRGRKTAYLNHSPSIYIKKR